MAFGLGVLHLPPASFWMMTPRELDAALRGHFGDRGETQPMTRPQLLALMQQFPDQVEDS